MALRAVVFDYGMVLSGQPYSPAREELKRITGLSHEAFESCYWTDRLAYDRGDLTGLGAAHPVGDHVQRWPRVRAVLVVGAGAAGVGFPDAVGGSEHGALTADTGTLSRRSGSGRAR